MRKTFPFQHPKHQPQRVLEQIKSDVRKYLKRERRKPLPEGIDFWDFDCKAGADAASAEPVHVSGLIAAIDAVSDAGHPAVHLEILAKPGHRSASSPQPSDPEAEEAG